MSAVRAVAVAFGLSLAAAPALAASGTSHALLWQTSNQSVSCGVKIHVPKKPATMVLCSAAGIPKAKHGIGDPFVQLAAHGKAQLVLISQNSFVGHKSATLRSGAKWSRLGVTCTIATTTATCKNKSKHGFTIGNGKYKSF
jgi:hypothetical protein